MIENSTTIHSTNVESSNISGSVDNSPVSNLASTSPENSNELVLDFLPDRPAPLEAGPSSEFLGMDPPLESLGLGSWYPPGRMQYFMEYLHAGIGLDLPWWLTIMFSKFYNQQLIIHIRI